MQSSSVQYNDLNPEFRWDAEYYRRDILERIAILSKRKHGILKDLAEFVVGPFGSTITSEQYVPDSDFKYIRNKDIDEFYVKQDELISIPESIYRKLPQFQIRENDLIFTVVGTLGKVAIARHKCLQSLFSCKSTLIRTKAINPFYLATYLNSPTGRLLSLRGKRGAIQEGLNLSDIRDIRILLPSELFQRMIEGIIRTALAAHDESTAIFLGAERSLIPALGLSDWQPRHRLSFIGNYQDTHAAGRIDAEYFQPKYGELVTAIQKYPGGYGHLGSLVSIKKCVEVGSEAYEESGIPFIRVSNLSPFGISQEKCISEALYAELQQHQPEKGEILLSKDATPGIAHHLRDNPPRMIPSGGILRLKVRGKCINADYLALVLNSILVKQQINRDVGGSVILHWRPEQVKNTIIPLLPPEQQEMIASKVTESFRLRQQAKHLLDAAKRAVEIAIEQDEPAARKWLDTEMVKAGQQA